MRPAHVLAAIFTVLSVTTLLFGLAGIFENAPGVWPEGWPTLVVVHALLAGAIGYYAVKTS
jgi:hypothetical protein